MENKMIKREKYLNQLIKAKNNGFPKVITGIRRCGKSYLLKEIFRDYLLSEKVSEENIISIDLDEDKNAMYRDPISLGEHVRKICSGKEMYYVFLDEIQKVYSIINPNLTDGKHVISTDKDLDIISFVDVVLGLSREKNIDLYITGSNSKMLSSDIITEFRDKATNIHLAPLSFEEFYNYTGGYETEALYMYMQYGGMPLAVLKDDEEKKEYLKGLFETTYFRDIVERNHLRRGEALDELCNIISASSGELLNSERISNTFLSVRKAKIAKQTVEDYVGYFIDAFILSEARRYDVKGRKEIGSLRKYYFTDTGLRNARLNFAFTDEGQMIENIVYNELCYNGYSVNVGTFDNIEKNKNGKSVRKTNEVDFYAKKGNRSYYIQVTADMFDEKTKKREIRPFVLLNDQIQKVIVVNKPIKESRDENGFTIIGVADFLLRFIK
ncbi:MAG: ATP-binding protein [Lachnospiraceae bacterium]|nr:ATP-binding protein [Lachnospiraceae bacterium]